MLAGIISDGNSGGTFLNWSVYYLSGKDHYYLAEMDATVPLVDNPLTDINAHKFVSNTTDDPSQFDVLLKKLQQRDPSEFNILYVDRFKTVPFISDPICPYTQKAIRDLQEVINKNVVLQTNDEHILYHAKFEGRVLVKKFNSLSEYNQNFDEQNEDFINAFFSDSKELWNSLNLTNTWDKREFFALNFRPYEFVKTIPNIDLTKNHFRLSSFDLFNTFDKTIVDLFDYLNLAINQERFDKWFLIYKKWQKIHLDRIQFVEYFATIMESIIHNYYLDLTRFNLDLKREAVIQHELIYKYGLTIKGWGLEKFPNNAQDLHKLLEPNVYHKVENIYGLS